MAKAFPDVNIAISDKDAKVISPATLAIAYVIHQVLFAKEAALIAI